MSVLCFYHSADLDGHCSGALVRRAHPSGELIGVNYGDEVPWSKIGSNTKVIIVDFSFPMEDMVRIEALCKKLIWIDHHKSAIDDAKAANFSPDGYRVIGRAGCELAAEFFFRFQSGGEPRAVHLLGRYDVWDHGAHPDVLPFQMGMRFEDTRPENDDLWHGVFYDLSVSESIIERGRVLLQYQDQENEKYAKSCAFETELMGLRCIAVNKRLTNSKIFDAVYDPERHDAMLTFGWQGGKWCCSLYTGNRPDVDVSVVAKAFGGGGHAGAAGFSCENLPFELR